RGPSTAHLHGLLRALITVEGPTEPVPSTFALGRIGRLLTRGAPGHAVLGMSSTTQIAQMAPTWARLADCIRHGRPAPALAGSSPDPFDGAEPDMDEFDQWMMASTRLVAPAIADAYDFGAVNNIIDLGSGYGALLPPILRKWPHLTAVALDHARCEGGASTVFNKTAISTRCRFVGADLLRDPIPAGADLYILKGVLHGYADERCRRL